jgi:hypothetical protein
MRLALLVFLLALPAKAPAAPITSTFDTDADGWTGNETSSKPFLWFDGTFACRPQDPLEECHYMAPPKFLGDLSGAGEFRFDLRQGTFDSPPTPRDVLVRITGTAGVMSAFLPSAPWDVFATYEISLAASAGWESTATIADVLADVTDLRIVPGQLERPLCGVEIDAAECLHGGSAIDNVVLTPEPSSGALLLVALATGRLARCSCSRPLASPERGS